MRERREAVSLGRTSLQLGEDGNKEALVQLLSGVTAGALLHGEKFSGRNESTKCHPRCCS
jgi:hypothetical protein